MHKMTHLKSQSASFLSHPALTQPTQGKGVMYVGAMTSFSIKASLATIVAA